MKKIFKIGSAVMLCLVLTVSLVHKVNAVNVTPGGVFSGSFNCGNYEGSLTTQGVNATMITGPNWCDRGATVSASASANSLGVASIRFVAVDLVDVSNMTQVANGTVLSTISANVVAPGGGGVGNVNPPIETPVAPTKDSNKKLSSLTIDKGELFPAFSADVLDYKVLLPKDTTSLAVDATAEAETSKIEIQGNTELVVGSNLIIVTVTAEDGTFEHYEITAIVDEDPTVFLPYEEEELGVVVNLGNTVVQEGYEETMIQIDGKEVKSYKNTFNGRTILYLSNKNGDRFFYLYDVEGNKIIGKITFIGFSGKTYGNIELPLAGQERKDMTYGDVLLEQNSLKGWSYVDETLSNYVHVYMMDETGAEHFYQYEKTENTLQIYHEDPKDENIGLPNYIVYVAIGLGVLSVIGLAAALYFYIANKRMNEIVLRRTLRDKNIESETVEGKEE